MVKKKSILKKFKKKKFYDEVFIEYDFWHSELKNVEFNNCKFIGCIFADVKFIDCKINNCEFINCNFQHASFTNCVLSKIISKNNLIDDVKIDKFSKIPNKFISKKKLIVADDPIDIKFSKLEKKIYTALTSGKGYIILKNFYSNSKISKAFKILDRIVMNDKKISKNKNIFHRNKRSNQKWVRSLLNIDKIFMDFMMPKMIEKVFSRLIGKDFICGSYAANCLLPGARGQELHIDYPHYRFVRPGKFLPYTNQKNFFFNLQIITPFTEFSKDNGSTAIVENSHKKNKFPNRNDIKKSKIKIIKMKPRSILIYNGLLWHGASPNFSTYKKRYAIVAQYMPNYIVPMEDLKKMTKKHLIKKNSTLKKLLGYDLEFPAIYKSK